MYNKIGTKTKKKTRNQRVDNSISESQPVVPLRYMSKA